MGIRYQCHCVPYSKTSALPVEPSCYMKNRILDDTILIFIQNNCSLPKGTNKAWFEVIGSKVLKNIKGNFVARPDV